MQKQCVEERVRPFPPRAQCYGAALAMLLAAQVSQAPAQTSAALDSADAVMSCMRANIPDSVQIKEVELVAVDRGGGQRTLLGRLYGLRENNQLRAMIKIGAPSDLAGAAYLMREREGGDEMFVYVPALRKVRRITGAGVDGSLWGTDLSYGDVKQLNNTFSAGQSRFVGAGTLMGRPVYLLEATPKSADESRFSAIRLWVDQETCVSLQAEFIEGSGDARKRLQANPEALQRSGEHWYAGEAIMSDLKEGTSTRMRVLGVSSDVDVSGRHFNPTTFYIGG